MKDLLFKKKNVIFILLFVIIVFKLWQFIFIKVENRTLLLIGRLGQ